MHVHIILLSMFAAPLLEVTTSKKPAEICTLAEHSQPYVPPPIQQAMPTYVNSTAPGEFIPFQRLTNYGSNFCPLFHQRRMPPNYSPHHQITKQLCPLHIVSQCSKEHFHKKLFIPRHWHCSSRLQQWLGG